VSLREPIVRFVVDGTPRLVDATANVTRTASVTAKIDQVADFGQDRA